ncbi:MAG: putative lipoprotein [Leptospiraceae bacterium]|nr:putative lipoprotein [Leptospiraceae bacterium]
MKLKILLLTLSLTLVFQNCSIVTSISNSSDSLNSISNSVIKLSDSVNSLSRSISSISGSLKGNKPESLYKTDVRDITALYAKDGLEGNFQKDISKIALKHGISDWEAYPATYIAIGEGLRKAKVEPNLFNRFHTKIENKESALLLKVGYTQNL